MKSPMPQIAILALAILFAMAFALTVSLVGLSIKNDAPITTTENTNEHSECAESTTLESKDPPSQTETAELAYRSNKDGTCELVGIGNYLDACIVIPEQNPAGDRVTSIAPRAFFGLSQITAVQIPASVNSIGELAFGECGRMVYISVNEQNPSFCDVDGILFTKDKRRLLFYPPMRAGECISISTDTTEIGEMAFYNCVYLRHVSYLGTADMWENIQIAPKNHSLIAASKSFLK